MMRFAVTLIKNNQPKIIEADSYTIEEGFVIFGDADYKPVIAFNTSKIESIKTLKET